jgi:hypothetical protein
MPSHPATMAERFLISSTWRDQRPYFCGSADADGWVLAGEVEDGVGLVAFEQVEGAETFVRFRGRTFDSSDCVSVPANGGGELWRPETVVGDHAD